MALNLGPVLCPSQSLGCARCWRLSRWENPSPCVLALDPATEGGKGPGTLRTRSSSPDQVTLRTGVNYKSRCLTVALPRVLLGRAALSSLPPRLWMDISIASFPGSPFGSSSRFVSAY